MASEITGWRRYALVEPPLALYLFGYSVTGAVLTDLMLYRSCQDMLGDRMKECDIMHTNSSSHEAVALEKLVQPHASYILMCKSFVDGLIPAFLALFLGSWSDKNGRKPLLIIGYGGSALSFLLWSIVCTMNINPWMYLIASIPATFAGGFCGIILASMCYIIDTGSTSNRTLHFAWMQAAIASGLFLGPLTSRFIFKEFGYLPVFGTACLCSSLAMIYVLFIVPESIVRTDGQRSWCSLFDVSLVKDMFVTCTKKRNGFDRTIVWCCIICLTINILVMEGDSSVTYMFSTVRLGWGVDEITLFQSIGIFLSIVGTLLGAKIFKKFISENMTDMLVAIAANVSYFAGSMTKALTTKPWHFYLSTVLAMIGPLSSPALRTALSAAAPAQDTGKVFSLTTFMEAIIPLAATPLYTLIYTNTLPPIYPSPIFLVSAGLYVIIILLIIVVDTRIRKTEDSSFLVVNEEIVE